MYSGYLMKRGLLAPLYRSGLVMRPPCLARQFIWSSRVLEQLHLMDVGGSRRGLRMEKVAGCTSTQILTALYSKLNLLQSRQYAVL